MMKKRILCLLLAVLLFSFFGCRSEKELSIGDTATTDRAEIILTNFALTKNISTEKNADEFLLPAAKEDRAAYDGKIQTADAEKVFACISYTYQNISKTIIHDACRKLPDGSCISQGSHIGAFIDIKYGDDVYAGYDTYCGGFRVTDGFRIDADGTLYPSPTDWATDVYMPPQTDRCYFELPAEVMENKKTPLSVIFYVPSEEGTTAFTYSVR